jgi:hypothetical protein
MESILLVKDYALAFKTNANTLCFLMKNVFSKGLAISRCGYVRIWSGLQQKHRALFWCQDI